MENQTPKMVSLNLNMTEQESRVLSKFLKKTIDALKHTLREHEEAKIKAETVIKLQELRGDDEDEPVDPLRALFEKLTGEDPVQSARDFLDHYDKCVKELNDGIIVMTPILESIKSQITKK